MRPISIDDRGNHVRTRWIQLCERIAETVPGGTIPGGTGSSPVNRGELAQSLFIRLKQLYATPPRSYHTLSHIADCLGRLDEFGAFAHDPILVEWSLWLHDCIYEPARRDNEERSADISTEFLGQLGARPRTAQSAATLIMATRHTGELLAGDAALVSDIDMSILAARPETYDAYAAGVRSEYDFASDAEYRRGRGVFLSALLARGPIYHTAEFRVRFEGAARANLAREIAALSDGHPLAG